MEHKMLFVSYFTFSKEVPKIIENLLIDDFMQLRNDACDALNGNYERWNAEFGEPNVSEDDPLKDFGGTKYCHFIQQKQRSVLQHLNQKHKIRSIILDSDEIGDIYGICRYDEDLQIHMELKPIKN